MARRLGGAKARRCLARAAGQLNDGLDGLLGRRDRVRGRPGTQRFGLDTRPGGGRWSTSVLNN